MTIETTLGDLLASLYEAALETYGDEQVAEVAASAMLNDMLIDAAAEVPSAAERIQAA